jgi:starch-binding outer membrane protein, SusD/RagB family
MKINYKISAFLSVFFIIACTSCKKFITIPPPITELVTTSVFSNNGAATAAQTAIYAQMETDANYYNIPKFTGLSSDELINYNINPSYIHFYTNSLSVNDGTNWSAAYNYIYQVNAVLEGVQSSEAIDTLIKKQLTGEAMFTRAFWYIYLVNAFGPVPLLTSTNYKINTLAFRSSVVTVYQQVIKDLENAENLLDFNYVDASDTISTIDRIRPTKWAAKALLARAHLYLGNLTNDQTNYSIAEDKATQVINNNSVFKLTDSLDDVFLKNSTEAIWQLKPVNPIEYTPESSFILLASPSDVTLSSHLYNAFENGDARKAHWIGSFTDISTNITYRFSNKYKSRAGVRSETEYSMVLRIAEQYLIRAEAYTYQNNIPDAQSDINQIRKRAGLDNTAASDQSSLLNAILHERRVELFTEWGHRWFDLKRTGSINSVMDTVTVNKGGQWQSYQQLYPIPLSDIQNAVNLVQNEGY